MDIEQQKIVPYSQYEPEEDYPEQEDEQQQPTTIIGNALNPNKKDKDAPKYEGRQLPRQFGKAKRTLTKLINQYFNQLKIQLLKHPTGKFIYSRQHIQGVEIAISKLATIRYTDLNVLIPKKSDIVDDFLLSYVSESKKIIKYNLNIHNNNNQKPKEVQLQTEQGFQLPDHATPAAFGANAYFFDGSKFDFMRMVYVPMQINYKVNLITGQVSKLESQPSFYRMKCCVLKVKRGFFIIGGYAGPYKSLTKQCSFYSIQSRKFHQIPSLNLLHPCPSGCIHQQKIYIFSESGIEYYNQTQNIWIVAQMPRRLHCLPYQYCISVSDSQIMLIGGKLCNRNSSDVRLYNCQLGRVDQFAEILPVGVTNQRSWGPMILNNFITVMSSIQASVFPQVTIKRDAVQLVLIGFGGCFLNTLIVS